MVEEVAVGEVAEAVAVENPKYIDSYVVIVFNVTVIFLNNISSMRSYGTLTP